MTHVEMIVAWFKARGGAASLREILSSGESWSHEFNARKTDLRQRTSYDLVLERGKKPSDNVYKLVDKRPASAPYETEATGQMRWAV